MTSVKKRALDPTTVTARLIQRCDPATPGAIQVGGAFYAPQDLRGMNGDRGFQAGHYERWMGVEGPFTLTVPNTAGPDGQLNIQRFLQRTDPDFQPGDEWIEIRRDGNQTHLYTGALINVPSATLAAVQVGGYDALWLLKKVRETDAGFWNHAPRDALEHYTRHWIFDVATTFPEPGAPIVTGGGPTTAGSYTFYKALTNTGLPICRLPSDPAGPSPYMEMATPPPNIGYSSAAPNEAWRVEASLHVDGPLTDGFIALESGLSLPIGISIIESPAVASGIMASLALGGSSGYFISAPIPASASIFPGTVDIAIEGRERWIYYYVQGELIGITPMPATYSPITQLLYVSGACTANVDVLSFTYRRARAWLMRGSDMGDVVLPGSPAPGGLQGTYYDDHDLQQYVGTTYASLLLSPDRTPYAARLDSQVAFTGSWQPPGPANGEMFSAVWTGSMYLDLKDLDYRLQANSVDDGVRVWIGHTRFGEQVIDAWGPASGTTTSGYLRALLGTTPGWYPIRIEYFNQSGPGAITFKYERSDSPGTFFTVPPTILSPEGIYSKQVRQDSHYDTYQAIAQAFGYQYTCEPQPLESGLFPGQVIPRVRVGRDTTVKVGTSDTTNLTLNSSGEDQAVMIVADASGIADPNGNAQLSATAINYAEATGHMFAVTETESLADITDPNLLAQRLNTLLALRSGTWDQISSNPDGHPELAETWPPNPALPVLPLGFAWEPGDGVFRNYPELGEIDESPTQLMSVAWDFTPGGLIAPQASYFIYPRGVYWTLRKFRQQSVAAKRNYQGQLAKYPGSIGGVTGTEGGSAATVAADQYSRIVLPSNARDLGRVWLQVTVKADPSVSWTIEVNGMATTIQAAAVGLYDVTAYAAILAAGSIHQMIARLTTTASPYDSCEYVLLAGVTV